MRWVRQLELFPGRMDGVQVEGNVVVWPRTWRGEREVTLVVAVDLVSWCIDGLSAPAGFHASSHTGLYYWLFTIDSRNQALQWGCYREAVQHLAGSSPTTLPVATFITCPV